MTSRLLELELKASSSSDYQDHCPPTGLSSRANVNARTAAIPNQPVLAEKPIAKWLPQRRNVGR